MKPKLKGVRFRAAIGEDLRYRGRKDIRVKPVGGGTPCSMEFHVTNSTEPLASAMAVVKAGHRMILDQGGSYVENELSKERVKLFEVGGAFAFETEPGHGARSASFVLRGRDDLRESSG